MRKIAIAMDDENGLKGQVAQHFGRCPYYCFSNVNDEGSVENEESLPNPYFTQHVPGVVPQFIHDNHADVIIAGGMGPRAISMFHNLGIDVVTGAIGEAGLVLQAYLEGKLSGVVPCAHDHKDSCGD